MIFFYFRIFSSSNLLCGGQISGRWADAKSPGTIFVIAKLILLFCETQLLAGFGGALSIFLLLAFGTALSLFYF